MYMVVVVDDINKSVKVNYENSKNEIDGAMRLMKFVQRLINGNIKNLEKNKFMLSNPEYELEFVWAKEEGLTINFVKSPVKRRFYEFVEECIRKINEQEASNILCKINDFIKGNAWFDFSVSEYDGFNLHIIGGIDLCYYHELEIIFEGASYFNISSDWHTSPTEDIVFSLGDSKGFNEINVYPIDMGYSVVIKIKPEDCDKPFYVACHGIKYSFETVRYIENLDTLANDKEKIIKKFGLFKEKNAWYQQKENSHKALIFEDYFFQKNDILGIIFRMNKLCLAKVKYFRKNIEKFEPYKYHYRNGFIKTELWDSEFLKHKASGYMIDFRFLQSITVYSEFVAFYKELESFEIKAGD